MARSENEMMIKVLAVFASGGVGVLCRYLSVILVDRTVLSRFPMGTFLVNMLGCFIIGIVLVRWIEPERVSPLMRLALMTGFLGGFTTFSSFSLESVELLRKGDYLYFSLYFLGSPFLGLLAALGGIFFAREVLS